MNQRNLALTSEPFHGDDDTIAGQPAPTASALENPFIAPATQDFPQPAKKILISGKNANFFLTNCWQWGHWVFPCEINLPCTLSSIESDESPRAW